ncbi:MAG: 50S ribosomal protein L24 [Candidatus Omnitrophica bacterium]|nr:50S ribosomal protein L24 [Candidatus Omnitrophota bacterium]
MRLKKNDTVTIRVGKDRGKKGKVLKTFPTENRVIVEGINYSTMYLRPNQENPKGGLAKFEAKIQTSNVQLVCPKCSKPTRIGHQILADGTKQRICKQCQEII